MTQISESKAAPQARERQNSIFERFLSGSPFAPANEIGVKSKGTDTKQGSMGEPSDARQLKDSSIRSMSIGSAGSLTSGQSFRCYNNEDYIAPVLDSSTEILSDPNTDFKDVTVIYCDCTDDGGKCENHLTRARSRSVLCNKLMRALEENPNQTSISKDHAMEQVPEDGKTINFYSFAETLEREDEVENFRARKMSEIIS